MVTLTAQNVEQVLAAASSVQSSSAVVLTERLMRVAEWLIERKGEPVDAIYVHHDGRRTPCRIKRRGTGRCDANVLLERFPDGRIASYPVDFAQVQIPAVAAARMERLAQEAEAWEQRRTYRRGHNIVTGQFTACANR